MVVQHLNTTDAKIPGNYRILDYNGDGVINGTGDKFHMAIHQILKTHTMQPLVLIGKVLVLWFSFMGLVMFLVLYQQSKVLV